MVDRRRICRRRDEHRPVPRAELVQFGKERHRVLDMLQHFAHGDEVIAAGRAVEVENVGVDEVSVLAPRHLPAEIE